MKNFLDLHKDVLMEILSYCDSGTLRSMAQVSSVSKALSDDEKLWRDLLIQDFHFTEESAAEFKRKMGGTYKLVYRYCEEDDLNEVQKNALKELKEYRVTENHLRGRYWFLEDYQIEALKSLIEKCEMESSIAIADMEGLDRYQLDGIVKRLSKDDVIGLSEYKIKALCKFKARGLTAEALRNYNCKTYYGSDWFCALEYLVDKGNLSFRDALDELDRLTEAQCRGVRNGISVSDVIGLSYAQISMIYFDRKRGKFLDLDKLRAQNWSDEGTWHPRIDAIRRFIYRDNMTCDEALDAVADLTLDEATAVANGCSKSDVIALTAKQNRSVKCDVNGNDYIDANNRDSVGIYFGFIQKKILEFSQSQSRLLIAYRHHGLTAEDLRKSYAHNGIITEYLSNCDWFSDYHGSALWTLRRRMTFVKAMSIMEGLNSNEAHGIAQGLSREEVTGLSRCKIQSLIDLKSKGLTIEHLRECDWFTDHWHRVALSHLIEKRNMTPDAAMNEIRDLTGCEAFWIYKGFSRDEFDKLSSAQMEELEKLRDSFGEMELYSGNSIKACELRGLIAELKMKVKYISVDNCIKHRALGCGIR